MRLFVSLAQEYFELAGAMHGGEPHAALKFLTVAAET